MFISRRYDVSFRDACRTLEGDDVFWDSLLKFVLYAMNDYSHTIVVAGSICISS
jgi:hypothetical protein